MRFRAETAWRPGGFPTQVPRYYHGAPPGGGGGFLCRGGPERHAGRGRGGDGGAAPPYVPDETFPLSPRSDPPPGRRGAGGDYGVPRRGEYLLLAFRPSDRGGYPPPRRGAGPGRAKRRRPEKRWERAGNPGAVPLAGRGAWGPGPLPDP